MRVIASVCLLLCLATWCWTGSFATDEPKAPVINRSNFFSPDQQRLKPHLEFDAECFVLDHDGKAKRVKITIEEWKAGKLAYTRHAASRNIPTDITLSRRDSFTVDNKSVHRFILAVQNKAGYISDSFNLPREEHDSVVVLRVNEATAIKPGEAKYMWAMCVDRKPTVEVTDPIPDALKKAAHAITFKVELDDAKE